jgi:hypothetical protein
LSSTGYRFQYYIENVSESRGKETRSKPETESLASRMNWRDRPGQKTTDTQTEGTGT